MAVAVAMAVGVAVAVTVERVVLMLTKCCHLNE